MILWDKWILDLLPIGLRNVRLFALLKVLTFPVLSLYASFVSWRNGMQLKASGTPQVCILKRLIFDELGIIVEIEEGNGKPIDFIIKTSFSDIDKERQLFALLDKYKLAGKSYGYENAEVKFSYEWSEYVCEQRTVFLQWGGFICERKYRPENHIKCNVTGSKITVTPEFAPTSEIIVTIESSWWEGEGWIRHSVNVTLPRNSTTPVIGTWPYDVIFMTASPNINEDDNYIYKIQWV